MEQAITYLRSFRIYDFAMFDYIMSYLTTFIILQVLGIPHEIKYYALVIPVSVLVHILTGQETRLVKLLFNKEINFAKIFFYPSLVVSSLALA